jgi:hypothetical protein
MCFILTWKNKIVLLACDEVSWSGLLFNESLEGYLLELCLTSQACVSFLLSHVSEHDSILFGLAGPGWLPKGVHPSPLYSSSVTQMITQYSMG